MPTAIEGVPSELLIPENTWEDKAAYKASCKKLAESFVENGLPLRSLTHALYFGHLGSQTVLISKKAFEAISFIEAKPVDKSVYFPLFKKRDDEARKAYQLEMKKVSRYKNDLFVMDIIRKEIDNNDARIQRILFK